MASRETAIVCITACIEYGIDTGKRIVGAIGQIGMNKRYIGMMLSDHTGNDPARHFWHRGEHGRYSLLPSVAAGIPIPR